MLEDYQEEKNRKKYQLLLKHLFSSNLKKFFVEKEFQKELRLLSEFYNYLIKNRLNNFLQEKNIKKVSYLYDDMNFLKIIQSNLHYKFSNKKNILKKIVSDSFSDSNKPEEILNSIIFWDKIFENLNYYSISSLENKLFYNENIDDRFYNQKYKDKYFSYRVIDIDSLYIKENYFQNSLINDSSNPINETNKNNKKDLLEKKRNFTSDLNLIKKNFEGKNQNRRKLMKLNQYYSYIPIDCNGFCNKLINFIKKRFFSHIFLNSKNNNDENPNQKFMNFTLEDFNEFEILIYKNCLFAHNQNEINFHFLKYKTKFCKSNNCNFFCCEKVHFDKCLDEELVILYKKTNNDFITLENYLKEKIMEKFKSFKAENDIKEALNLNNLDDSFINSNFDSNSYEDNSSSKIFDNENKAFFPKKLKHNILDLDYVIENIKTQECQLKNLCIDKKKCFKFHNSLERRRDPKNFLITNNQVCKYAIHKEKWVDPSGCPQANF